MDQIPFAQPDITEAEISAVAECMRSGWLTSGAKVREFETSFAKCVDADVAIATNSATSAAMLILQAAGVGMGTEVVVPTYTFSGPAMMAHHLGARLVFADCSPGSYQISPQDIARKVTANTRVVMPTHFAGAACDLEGVRKAAGTALVIDDAAHAFPTGYKGVYVGSNKTGGTHYTDATFFSFYATKCLTTGDGGMITLREGPAAESVRRIRQHGFSKELFDRYTNPKAGWAYDVAAAGWKANMTDMAAAMGQVQLLRSVEMWTKRRSIALRYLAEFSTLAGYMGLPFDEELSAWHLFPIQVLDRDDFIDGMRELGVQCSVHFIPLHRHSFWANRYKLRPEMFPNAEAMFQHTVSLPIFSKMTDQQVEYVVKAAKTVILRQNELKSRKLAG